MLHRLWLDFIMTGDAESNQIDRPVAAAQGSGANVVDAQLLPTATTLRLAGVVVANENRFVLMLLRVSEGGPGRDEFGCDHGQRLDVISYVKADLLR